ncbi:hypothetical protein [Peptoniphilus porci]|uniref:Ferric reductase like transmembrane component n=1 Tax=Peptoniphilus porci TaxID=2652280 RepID=A0A1U7M1Z0_9FIRM|nr:hypothetical protein [Peptoniphilus porci]OLR65664.1 hypothetical protein BIV18_09155 [Peptoniphilus porci]
MILVESIIIVLLFVALFKNLIKRNSIPFYILAALINFMYIKIASMPMVKELNPAISKYLLGPLNRGAIGTAFIIIVMYIGVLKKDQFVRELMQIRGELAIIGSIIIFGHNILFGKIFFVQFFTDMSSLEPLKLVATIISLVMIAILIPLFLTSFKTIRKKMNPGSWKKLQKLAYTFFYLIFIHVIVLYSGHIKDKVLDVVIYVLIWGYYTIKLVQKNQI